jgi:hypothetical protein
MAIFNIEQPDKYLTIDLTHEIYASITLSRLKDATCGMLWR